jgi:hypothetical protein
LETAPETLQPVERIEAHSEEVKPVMKKAANYFVNPLMAHGGQVLLTETDVVFVPHQFNLVQRYRLVTPIAQVVRVWKSGTLSKQVNIQTRDGEVKKFVMWGRDEFIQELESRMHATGAPGA